MIIFQPLRTKRVCVRPRELTLGQATAILKMPGTRYELLTTEFLRAAASDATAPTQGHVTDPRLWTVQERALLVCHYLSQVSDSGPDIEIGNGKLSDYVVFANDLKTHGVDVGEVAGKARHIIPLLGAHAEVLERLCKTRGDWLVGAMACQVTDADTPPLDLNAGDVELMTEVDARMDAIRALPESEFDAMLGAWSMALAGELRQFFAVNFDDGGVVFDPQTQREAGPTNPARFLAVSCIGERTRALFG